MQGKVIVITVDGLERVMEYSRALNVEDLQQAVAGYFRTVPFFEHYKGEPCVVMCNEEGERHNLPMNFKASKHWFAQQALFSTMLVGDVAVVQGDDEFMAAL